MSEKSLHKPLYALTLNELEPIFKTWMLEVLKSMQPEPEEKLLSRWEVCELLHISYPTILNYEKRGLLKGYRIGHKIFYDYNEIMQKLTK